MQKITYCKKKMFEMLFKKSIEKEFKSFVTVIYGLHFNRTPKTNYEKYDEKCYDQ